MTWRCSLWTEHLHTPDYSDDLGDADSGHGDHADDDTMVLMLMAVEGDMRTVTMTYYVLFLCRALAQALHVGGDLTRSPWQAQNHLPLSFPLDR